MDKRTIIAVVLSVVVISVSMIIQGVIWPRDKVPADQVASDTEAVVEEATSEAAESAPQPQALESYRTPSDVLPVANEEDREDQVRITSDLFTATLSNRGGVLTSAGLKPTPRSRTLTRMWSSCWTNSMRIFSLWL